MTRTAKSWNATAAERSARYPCDDYLPAPTEGWWRAIDVDAPTATTFRWLCQLRIARYSYRLPSRRRAAPRELTPGADELAHGQHFLVFELLDFEPGVHLSGVVRPEFERRFGKLAITYLVTPRSDSGSRMLVKVDLPKTRSRSARLRRYLLACADLVMMRKQLRTLKQLAEATSKRQESDR
jgi:hypothetical protein